MKRKNKNILFSIVGVLLIFGAVMGVISIFSVFSNDDELKVISPNFSRGGLNDNGEYRESNRTLYTREAFDCQDLKIELDFESNIAYRVFFYKADGSFISSTDKTKKVADLKIPFYAEKARIVIYPTLGVNDELSIFSIPTYTNQMTVKVAKNMLSLSERYPASDLVYGLKYQSDYPEENLLIHSDEVIRVDSNAIVNPVDAFEGKTLTRIDLAVDSFSAIDDNQYFTLFVIDSSVIEAEDIPYEMLWVDDKYFGTDYPVFDFSDFTCRSYKIYVPKYEITDTDANAWFGIDLISYGITVKEGETICLFDSINDSIKPCCPFESSSAPFYCIGLTYLEDSDTSVYRYQETYSDDICSLPVRIYAK